MPNQYPVTPDEVSLPDEPEPPITQLNKFRILIYGVPKVGKSSLANQFPNAVFAKTEEGTSGLNNYGVTIDSWSKFLGFVDEIVEGDHNFDTVVVDTYERLYSMCADAVAEAAEVSHISDIGFGGGYLAVQKKLEEELTRLFDRNGYGVVLVSHAREVEDVENGMQVTRTVPDLSQSARKFVLGWSDIIWYLTIEEDPDSEEGGNRRVAICQPQSKIEAGGRIKYMPEKITISPNAQTGFNNLSEAFDEAIEKELDELGLSE